MTKAPEDKQRKYVLRDEDGAVLSTFDLTRFPIPLKLADALLRAHQAEYGHLTIETKRQAFRCIRKLILSLTENSSPVTLPLDKEVAFRFHEWLIKSKLQNSTRQSIQNIVKVILAWCLRNTPGVMDRRTSLTVPSFDREDPHPKRNLSKEQQKAVLSACYHDIDEVERRLNKTWALLQLEPEAVPASESVWYEAAKELLDIGEGAVPSQKLIHRSRRGLARRVQDLGGIKEFRRQLSLTLDDVIPFYLAILIQVGGNPMAVRLARADSVVAHPLRTDIERVVWEKPRAAKQQMVDFPKDKQWSAPNIIRRLLTLNHSLRPRASKRERELLFIASGRKNPRVRVPSFQQLHNSLAAFLKRHLLEEFDFRDWRPAVAKAHRRAAGGSVEPARRRLNHKSSRTTALYTSPAEVSSTFDRKIARFQGSLVQSHFGAPAQAQAGDAERRDKQVEGPADTVFGFKCEDPFAGLDGVTPKGRRCLNLERCATCPGALVPVDDPVVVSRLLAARAALEATKANAERTGRQARFRAVYQDTLTVLNTEVLPFVAKPVQDAASHLVQLKLIPPLE